jgi:predicted nucleotide-binding protein
MAVNRTRRQSKSEKATRFLTKKSKELLELLNKGVFKNSNYYTFYFKKWCSETEYVLIEIFGKDSSEVANFKDALSGPGISGTKAQVAGYRRRTMLRVAAEIEAILSTIKKYGVPEKLTAGIPPHAFIAHGGKTAARDKLQDFLMALGVTPIIVEKQPSQGRSKDKNVEHYLKQCDCAIILATKGDIDGRTGEFIPRGNILIEIGRSQEILPDRMIYLLEEGAKFPTDIDEKVWERFTKESMDKAFTKIAKEFRAFGLIRAIKPAR